LLVAYGLFGYHLMDLVPVGRDVLVEHLDDAIVMMDSHDRIVDINPKALEFADPIGSQPIGKKLKEVFPRWVDVISNGASLEQRTEVKLENVPSSYLDLMAVPLKDRQGQVLGKLVSWRDVTGRKQVEEQLRIFFMAVEQNPTAILLTDPQGRIEYVNSHLVQLTGYSLEEIRGRTPSIFHSGETSDQLYASLWGTIRAGHVWKGELLNRKKNGNT